MPKTFLVWLIFVVSPVFSSGQLIVTDSASVPGAASNPNGAFEGTLTLRPSGDGVHMKVVDQFAYTDKAGDTLSASPGFETDGASIPRPLWSIAGSPFTGKYIGAAVIHDVGCDTHKYSWQVTHRMFFTAMLAAGVDPSYAKLLYWGVRLGGPKWEQRSFTGKDETDVLNQASKATAGKANTTLSLKYVPEFQHPSHGLTMTEPASVEALVSLPVPDAETTLTDAQVAAFYKQLKDSEASKSGSITLDEIDAKTPFKAGQINDSIKP